MNLGGLAVLLLVVCGGVAGLYLIISDANLNAPVDSFGATTSVAENLTRSNATGNATSLTATAAGGGIILIIAVMIMSGVIIYLVSARHGHSRSRYQ